MAPLPQLLAKLLPDEAAQYHALAQGLSRVELGADTVFDDLVPAIRDFLGSESVLITTPVEHGDALRMDRFHVAGLGSRAGALQRHFEALFPTSPIRYAWYNPIRPEPDQRNRVVEATTLATRDELERSRVYREVLVPAGVAHLRQPRILLCEGPALLGWFGSFQSEPLTRRLRERLAIIAPAVGRRLAVERKLLRATTDAARLHGALESLAVPALLVTPTGSVVATNVAGRAALDRDRTNLRAALADALRGEHPATALTVTPIHEAGVSPLVLVTMRPCTATRLRDAVVRAADRWQLTPRQRAVLGPLLAGHSTERIAADLRVTRRAIELHITALLDRAQVATRAALTAAVLG